MSNTDVNRPQRFRFGAITWNVGSCFTEEGKTQELFQTYFHELFENEHPHVLVVSLQEYVTPKSSSTGRRTRFMMAAEETQEEETMYTKPLQKLAGEIAVYGYESVQTNKPYTCTKNGKFGMITFLFKKPDVKVEVLGVKILCASVLSMAAGNMKLKPENTSGTKGVVAIRMMVQNIEVHVLNTHMPFKSTKATETFLKDIWSSLDYYPNDTTPYLFFMGDLNSRSILTRDCYKKDVNNCNSSRPNADLYCDLKRKMEALTFEESMQKFRPSRIHVDKVVIPRECALSRRLKPPVVIDSPMGDVVNMLTESDALRQNMDWMNYPGVEKKGKSVIPKNNDFDFIEADFPYLPTYKRDETSGRFSLSKGKHGRLPGYADRIVYSTRSGPKGLKKPEPLMYKPLGVTGNDHLPVAGVFIIPAPHRRNKVSMRRYSPEGSKSVTRKSRGSTVLSTIGESLTRFTRKNTKSGGMKRKNRTNRKSTRKRH
jgi:hypothetical protein